MYQLPTTGSITTSTNSSFATYNTPPTTLPRIHHQHQPIKNNPPPTFLPRTKQKPKDDDTNKIKQILQALKAMERRQTETSQTISIRDKNQSTLTTKILTIENTIENQPTTHPIQTITQEHTEQFALLQNEQTKLHEHINATTKSLQETVTKTQQHIWQVQHDIIESSKKTATNT
jgi:hypothetical protein